MAKELQILDLEKMELDKTSLFNTKKNKLKAFSEKLPKQSDLPTVPTSGGLFNMFSYHVKGSDLNDLTNKIQDHIIRQNQVLVRTIKEFNTIYDTFNALDKEYIQGILVSLKAAEEANAKALKGIEGVRQNQHEIRQIIEQQKQVIQVLRTFKEDLEQLHHLKDIDEIYDDISIMQNDMQYLSEQLTNTQDQLDHSIKEVKYVMDQKEDHMAAEIARLNQLTERLSKNLKIARIFSFIGLPVILLLVILNIAGVFS